VAELFSSIGFSSLGWQYQYIVAAAETVIAVVLVVIAGFKC